MTADWTTDWTPLDRELDRWSAAGLTLPLWWRDDDAVAPSSALDRLGTLAQTLGLSAHLAVIPKGATQALAEHISATPQLIPMVHGWAHISHAVPGDKKAEFGDHRPPAALRADAEAGIACLSELFGPRLTPVFVPPWNRISTQIIAELPDLGYTALSKFTPRAKLHAAPGLVQINTHLDPIAWKTGRGLADPYTLITQLVRQLEDRRLGRTDNDEPYGILTHHLVHNQAIWAFTEALLARLVAGPTRLWTTHDLTQKDTAP